MNRSTWATGWRAWMAFAAVHVLVLGLLACVAASQSAHYPQISPQAKHLRLIPLSPR